MKTTTPQELCLKLYNSKDSKKSVINGNKISVGIIKNDNEECMILIDKKLVDSSYIDKSDIENVLKDREYDVLYFFQKKPRILKEDDNLKIPLPQVMGLVAGINGKNIAKDISQLKLIEKNNEIPKKVEALLDEEKLDNFSIFDIDEEELMGLLMDLAI